MPPGERISACLCLFRKFIGMKSWCLAAATIDSGNRTLLPLQCSTKVSITCELLVQHTRSAPCMVWSRTGARACDDYGRPRASISRIMDWTGSRRTSIIGTELDGLGHQISSRTWFSKLARAQDASWFARPTQAQTCGRRFAPSNTIRKPTWPAEVFGETPMRAATR